MYRNRQKRGAVILISGPEATGKTTLSLKLSRRLSCPKSTFLGFHYLTFMILALLKGILIVLYPKAFFLKKSSLLDYPRLASLYYRLLPIIFYIELLSLHLAYYIKIRLPLFLRGCIIVDEGIINIIGNYLELATRVNDPRVWRFHLALIVRVLALNRAMLKQYKVYNIYLDIDFPEQLKRVVKRGKPTTTVGGLYRRRTFLELARRLYARTLGGEVHEVYINK
ncbi:hypothetical protein IG193_02065 [Infirmifilum lucidum]|uniref:Thymidylate kinase n=1 Tax=Infirmifilum lucidum TaxID=2776706 RepID=A0A7L9FHZ1_9CREN|nr:hypothetical protein [Infirmifilum lucidum]QOJ79271.1 hypothetical protein IG193_02065 [Infirmifilum lucidum]